MSFFNLKGPKAKTKGTPLNRLCHPTYNKSLKEWKLYRGVWASDDQFIEDYLKKVSKRETPDDFTIRKELAYIPAHAKTAVLEVRNSIYERFTDIARNGGSDNYQRWVAGEDGGVDGAGMTMNKFLGTICLTELLVAGRVGVYVDAPVVKKTTSKADAKEAKPYVYVYNAEDIRTWCYKGNSGKLSTVLLRDSVYECDPLYGLEVSTSERYKLLSLESDELGTTVRVRFFDSKGDKDPNQPDQVLDIDEIPFTFKDLDHSILSSVAKHQVALLNTASTDLQFILKANHSVYLEQYDATSELAAFVKGANDSFEPDEDGSKNSAESAGTQTAEMGTSGGRRYPIGTHAPSFINPSPETLEASMKKQEAIMAEIRQLVMLSVSSLSPDAVTTEHDTQGLEAGLSYIGMTLQEFDRDIANLFAIYENDSSAPEVTINFPVDYRVRSEADRRAEAKDLIELLPKIPSLTYQKHTAIRIADLQVGHWVSTEVLAEIHKEIMSADVIQMDPTVIHADLEKGLVSEETASKARLYADGEIKQARLDHAARIARIKVAQTLGTGSEARGLDDEGVDPASAKDEKSSSQDADISEDAKKGVRGKQDKETKE